MTSVEDFGNTTNAAAFPRSPISPVSSHDGLPKVRKHSTASALSVEGMRHRHRSRSNTVRTYHEPDQHNWQPGSEPGIAPTTQEEGLPAALAAMRSACEINIIDFSENEVRHNQADNASLAACLAEERPSTLPCRWISVNGLSGDVINVLGDQYGLHPLAIEDLAHPRTRTKVDWYADHACVVLTLQKLVRLHNHKGATDGCGCSSIDQELEEKLDRLSAYPRDADPVAAASPTRSPRRKWWQPWRRYNPDVLPTYLDRNQDGHVDEFVPAHSGLSESTPIRPIRTLHRYESVQVPEHTAFMEKHSVLSNENLAVSVEQVSLFLLDDNLVISFFEHSAGDVEDPIIERLKSPQTMLRRSCDASLMLQAIIDAIVDLAVPVRDAYNRARKELQIDAMTNPNIKTSRALHIFGEEVDMLQNLFRPIVHLVNALRDHNASEPLRAVPAETSPPANMPDDQQQQQQQRRGHHHKRPGARNRDGTLKVNRSISDFRRTMLKRNDLASSVAITSLAHTYFGDVLDHCITMIQSFEQMDASANNISTLIFNTVGAKTNNFMMILAVVTVLFAPLTFISGYFGMNFAEGSGLAHPFSFFWVVAIPSLAAFTLLVFATMVWDSIRDWFARRGLHAHRRNRHKMRSRAG